MVIRLWNEANHTLYSDIFAVPEGKAAILMAAGLEGNKVKATDTEISVPQTFCIHRLVLKSDTIVKCNTFCNWVVESTPAEIETDQVISICNNCWTLTDERNFAIIGVPGLYRASLNDATLVGVAQLYAELVALDSIHSGTANLFF